MIIEHKHLSLLKIGCDLIILIVMIEFQSDNIDFGFLVAYIRDRGKLSDSFTLCAM